MADELLRTEGPEIERFNEEKPLVIGSWVWVKRERHRGYDEDRNAITEVVDALVCIVGLGTNYVELEGPYEGSWRQHVDNFTAEGYIPEPNPEAQFSAWGDEHVAEIRKLQDEARAICAKLGLHKALGLPAPVGGETHAISLAAKNTAAADYKGALIAAKDKDLPALFKEIKEQHELLMCAAKWKAVELKATALSLHSLQEEVDGRLLSLSLYAGLGEDVAAVIEGDPAPATEKLHVFQQTLYMDEESLLDYEHGGMEFDDICDFDQWLAKPANLERLLPFPRTVVAFQVRRNVKSREARTLWQAFVNIHLAEQDKLTFLYVRNGSQLWRLSTDIEFRSNLVPDRDEFVFDEPMMYNQHLERFKPKRVYDEELRVFRKRKAEYKENERNRKQWDKEHPEAEGDGNPYPYRSEPYDRDLFSSSWYELNDKNIFLDDANKQVEQKMQQYNRIVMVLQGLFDRTVMLHPHPPARLWQPENFSQLIEIVYDGDRVIHYGEPPDFDRYRAELASQLGVGSVVTGQWNYWYNHLLPKVTLRHDSYREVPDKKYGDPGPQDVGAITEWKPKSRAAVFHWKRERLREGRWGERNDIACKAVIPAEHLFNISAYKPGDFLIFFRDPRTRRNYLKWAPLLLLAEEWHAGNVEDGEFRFRRVREVESE